MKTSVKIFCFFAFFAGMTALAYAENAKTSQAEPAKPAPGNIVTGDFGAWDPYEDFQKMHDMMQKFFSRGVRDPWRIMMAPGMGTRQEAYLPDFDFRQTFDEYIIEMDLPGVKKEEIQIEVQNDILQISGERQKVETKEKETEEGLYMYQGRSFGTFQRSLEIPDDAKEGEISAKYEEGVLTVRIPKEERAINETKLQIPVQ